MFTEYHRKEFCTEELFSKMLITQLDHPGEYWQYFNGNHHLVQVMNSPLSLQ